MSLPLAGHTGFLTHDQAAHRARLPIDEIDTAVQTGDLAEMAGFISTAHLDLWRRSVGYSGSILLAPARKLVDDSAEFLAHADQAV